ncbi:MAG TPA: RNase adapter RapZ [Myxococcota bacterium]|nr:RNase adapter RapZ [Myxococcota bacterium]
MSDARPQIVLVSGLSGSGKSTAMSALEDIAFYCVDNLPVQLVEQFLGLCRKTTPPVERIALAVDAREGPFLGAVPAVPELARELRASGAALQLIFLDCANDVLVARYRETRRVHPLAPAGPVEEGIERERRLLVEVAALADHVIDTSSLNVHQLRAAVVARISGSARPTVVNLVSFGFRHPSPPNAELLFDVRFLPNPYFEEGLRERSGSDPDVAKFVLDHPLGQALCARLLDLLGFLLPLYDDEGKSYLTVGVGCTGGRHRSVAVVNALAEPLRRSGREVNVEHRDAERSR